MRYLWIDRQPGDAAGRRERFENLRRLSGEMRHEVEGRMTATRSELGRCGAELDANEILQRRDYAFCLYPESVLKPFCRGFL